jgi:hypothetical protein
MKKYNDLTVIMTWYGQEDHLYAQCEFYNQMAQKYKFRPRVIIVNDGHEEGRQYFRDTINIHKERFDLIGIDVMKDMGFNSHACKNLAMKFAKTDWVLLTDVDCYESAGMYHFLRFEKELDQNMYYVPKADMEAPENMSSYELLCRKGIIKYITHPNIWIMTREAFWSTGGYDLEFQGVRHGDAEIYLGIGRPGYKDWDYELLSDNDKHRIIVKTPKRDPFYIRQEKEKQSKAADLINWVRLRNKNPYKKYRKKLYNFPYQLL